MIGEKLEIVFCFHRDDGHRVSKIENRDLSADFRNSESQTYIDTDHFKTRITVSQLF